MATLVSANFSISGANNPNTLVANLTVEVGFTEFEKELFSKIGNVTPFVVQAFIRNVDPAVPIPGDAAPLSAALGKRDVHFNAGANVTVSFSKNFNRSGELNEDPFPFPANGDELNVIVYLDNTFSNSDCGHIWSNTVTGNF